ncbi:MAG TPA: hypothetical protein VG602_03745 [Actinomycetota bacterium]|nr:hypothetical protein [Actinomycetota bacterium]
MKAVRLAATAAVTLALIACSRSPVMLPVGELAEPGARTPITQESQPSPEVDGPPRAASIARFIERKYELVDVWGLHASGGVISYALRMRLDARSDHPDFDDWQAHVSQAVRDQRQASVEMLKLTVERIRRAGLVSVFQDEFLQPHWSRRQILDMDHPQTYRDFEAWQDLVLSAAYLPGFSPQ